MKIHEYTNDICNHSIVSVIYPGTFLEMPAVIRDYIALLDYLSDNTLVNNNTIKITYETSDIGDITIIYNYDSQIAPDVCLLPYTLFNSTHLSFYTKPDAATLVVTTNQSSVTNEETELIFRAFWMRCWERVHCTHPELNQEFLELIRPDLCNPDGTLAQPIVDTYEKNKALKEEEENRERERKIKAQVDEVHTKLVESLSKGVIIKTDTALKLSNLQDLIACKQDDIVELRNNLSSVLASLRNLNEEYTQLLNSPAKDIDLGPKLLELIENPNSPVKFVDVDHEYITLVYVLPITYWEDDEVDQWTCSSASTSTLVKCLTSKKYSLVCLQSVMFSFCKNRISNCPVPTGFYQVIKYKYSDLIKHPHVGTYNCFGTNTESLIDACNDKNLDLVIAILNNTLMQINLTDGCVIKRLADDIKTIYKHNKTWLNNETGEYVDYVTVVKDITGKDIE